MNTPTDVTRRRKCASGGGSRSAWCAGASASPLRPASRSAKLREVRSGRVPRERSVLRNTATIDADGNGYASGSRSQWHRATPRCARAPRARWRGSIVPRSLISPPSEGDESRPSLRSSPCVGLCLSLSFIPHPSSVVDERVVASSGSVIARLLSSR